MPRQTDTAIPGLTIEWGRVSASLYATIRHTHSGLIAMQFTGAPLPFGKREFVRRFDASEMASVNWNVPADQLDKSIDWKLASRAKTQVLA